MENLKNIKPLEDFDWESYEKGSVVSEDAHKDMEKSYDETLNKVNAMKWWTEKSSR